VLKPATARDVKCAVRASRELDRPQQYSFKLVASITMDDEDHFGFPGNYYSHYSEAEATPRHYSENFPTSPFDEYLDEPELADKPFDDSGEYMRVILICSILYQANLYAHDSAIRSFSGTIFWRPI
jgi:hypothetical protein